VASMSIHGSFIRSAMGKTHSILHVIWMRLAIILDLEYACLSEIFRPSEAQYSEESASFLRRRASLHCDHIAHLLDVNYWVIVPSLVCMAIPTGCGKD
jgi:hypothetical protein